MNPIFPIQYGTGVIEFDLIGFIIPVCLAAALSTALILSSRRFIAERLATNFLLTLVLALGITNVFSVEYKLFDSLVITNHITGLALQLAALLTTAAYYGLVKRSSDLVATVEIYTMATSAAVLSDLIRLFVLNQAQGMTVDVGGGGVLDGIFAMGLFMAFANYVLRKVEFDSSNGRFGWMLLRLRTNTTREVRDQ